MPAFIDITGQRFGRLVVTGMAGRIMSGGKPLIQWHCRCDCGAETKVNVAHLRNGHTVSCGCSKTEAFVRRNTRHGDSIRGEYIRLRGIWGTMHQRCSNPKAINYLNYGGRGITVCSEWSDYIEFRYWAILNGYQDHLTIDRIDNDGNYEPDNCRWVTYSVNLMNRRPRRKNHATGR